MDRQYCWKCGVKLLVASGSTSDRGFGAPGFGTLDEHVLERVSAIEYALSALGKRLDSLAETLERVAANNFIDHTMIETLTESLESAGINLSNLEADWRKRIDSRMAQNEEVDRLGERMEHIIASYHGPHRTQFTMWIERAYELLASDRRAESLSSLESALEQDPSNHELGMLLAEVSFRAGDFASAGRRLAQVLQVRPDHFEATLLMGLLEKNHRNLKQAQKLLERAVHLRDDSHAAHASLGSLFMDRGDSAGAVIHLNRAIELRPTAATHFMLGAVHHQDGRRKQAIKHLEQATALDPDFGEAFYRLGLAFQEMNWSRKAEACFQHARRLNPDIRYPGTGKGREPRESRRKPRNPVSRWDGKPRSRSRPTPDPLNGLVCEELRLTTCWEPK